ncbi:MAG: hypothetical protein AAF085_12095 [Planctomycetota bacterium]
MTMANTPWLVRVLEAFRDAMNAGAAAAAPDTVIDWPKRGEFQGPYQPFVWFEVDPIRVIDNKIDHPATVIVTGIIVDCDHGNQDESELIQAITAYSAMRQTLALRVEDDSSVFNKAFEGEAEPHPEVGGLRPTDGDDFDGRSIIGERWLVTGLTTTTGSANS